MNRVANYITDRLIAWQIIDKEDYEIYQYGFLQGFVLVVNMIVFLIIGFLFHMLWQTIVFTIAYRFLRTVAGGYHARTQRDCYILSALLLIIALIIIRWFPWNTLIALSLLVGSGMMVFRLAPEADLNKPINEKEFVVYRKKSRFTYLLLATPSVILLFLGFSAIAQSIVVAIFAASIMLPIGRWNNRRLSK